MEENTTYKAQLQESLERYKEYLDTGALPRLKDSIRILHTAFKALHSVLLKKGLLHEDPYKNDLKISEISNPPEGAFPESEKVDQMSIRLSTFESQLDFLLNYYQFSTEFLGIARIKLLVNLLRYITWDQLSGISPDLTTRFLAEFVGKIKKGNDSLSAGIINDSIEQVRKYSKACLEILKELADYHKEVFKLAVRLEILENLNLDPEKAFRQKDETLRLIRKRFSAAPGKRPYYPDLVSEIVEEEFGPDSPDLKENILKKFTVKESQSSLPVQKIMFSSMLLDAIRTVAAAYRYLDDSAQKLTDNSLLAQSRKLGIFTLIKKWLVRHSSKKDESPTYEVEYFDITTSSKKRENIHFESFIEDVRKHARVYSGISSKASNLYRKMERAEEDRLFAFLIRQMEEINLIFRRLQALDTFFKDETDHGQRANLRGIKIELTAIKNNIVRANQKKHEYVGRKEEAEQLKKLGVPVNPE